MKKIILVLIVSFLMFGCTNINKASIDELINDTLNSKYQIYNEYRKGYKYYLPSTMLVAYNNGNNEILSDNNYDYYLYVDLISYDKKTEYSYEVKDNAYVSKKLNGNYSGYLEINEKNDKYLIEIMYNYAKIEVMVDKYDINKAVVNALTILTTIGYKDDIVKKVLFNNSDNNTESTFNIFETNSDESNFLEYLEEYGTYEGEDAIPDYDLIN